MTADTRLTQYARGKGGVCKISPGQPAKPGSRATGPDAWR
jgi:hypothetical protein